MTKIFTAVVALCALQVAVSIPMRRLPSFAPIPNIGASNVAGAVNGVASTLAGNLGSVDTSKVTDIASGSVDLQNLISEDSSASDALADALSAIQSTVSDVSLDASARRKRALPLLSSSLSSSGLESNLAEVSSSNKLGASNILSSSSSKKCASSAAASGVDGAASSLINKIGANKLSTLQSAIGRTASAIEKIQETASSLGLNSDLDLSSLSSTANSLGDLQDAAKAVLANIQNGDSSISASSIQDLLSNVDSSALNGLSASDLSSIIGNVQATKLNNLANAIGLTAGAVAKIQDSVSSLGLTSNLGLNSAISGSNDLSNLVSDVLSNAASSDLTANVAAGVSTALSGVQGSADDAEATVSLAVI